jgi:hypothetical protein
MVTTLIFRFFSVNAGGRNSGKTLKKRNPKAWGRDEGNACGKAPNPA